VGDGAHPYKARPVAGTHVWLTPPQILSALGPFDLDPCAASEPRPWPTADNHYTEADDGLRQHWYGRVWLNPPFGSQTGVWLRRLADHGNGIALTFARTDTAMFQQQVFDKARAILFLAGRPHFHLPDGSRAKGNSGGPICLIAYSPFNAQALEDSGLPGKLLRIR
jgi:hypothetical protein